MEERLGTTLDRCIFVLLIITITIVYILEVILAVILPLWGIVWLLTGYNYYRENKDYERQNFLTKLCSWLDDKIYLYDGDKD